MESHDWMLWKVEFDVPGTTHKRSFFSIHVAAQNIQTACRLAKEWNDSVGDEEGLAIISVELVDTFLVRPSAAA